jgi:hypothetical protein
MSNVNTLTIITGASSNHSSSLLQLLSTVLRFEPDVNVFVYDLGLTKEETDKVHRLSSKFEVRKFDFSKYPTYFDIKFNAGEYAWKPVIIADVMNELDSGYLIWLDAGNKIVEPLIQVRKVLKEIGIYSPVSSGTIKEWTHSLTIQRMMVTNNTKQSPNRSGGLIGINLNRIVPRDIIQCWKAAALKKRFIAPRGSNRNNHRQDQSILSILISQATKEGLIRTVPHQYMGISVHNDIDN